MIVQIEPGAPASMEITVTSQAMLVTGEIDASNCGVLREAIQAAHVEGGPVRLDMSGVDFIDSAGIGALIGSFKSNPDGVVVVRPSDSVERVLQITGLYARFVEPQ